MQGSEITNQARQKELETMQQNIQQYQQTVSQELQKKSVDELVELFKEEAISIRNNWFSNYKEIPEKYHSEILTMLQKKIELFNLTPQS